MKLVSKFLGSSEAWALAFELAQSFTNNAYTDGQKDGILKSGITRRAKELGFSNLEDYLELLGENEQEFVHFISAVTIHTTSWFREQPHFDALRKHLVGRLQNNSAAKITAFVNNDVFRVMVAACSTGEEAYSYALVLEDIRSIFPGFDYRIEAYDVDPKSVATAQSGIYEMRSMPALFANQYGKYIRIGKGKALGFFTLSKEIRGRITWDVKSLMDKSTMVAGSEDSKFDWISCRNVLIYFEPKQIQQIVKMLMSNLKSKKSILCLGHSDNISARELGLTSLGASLFAIEGATISGDKTKDQKEKSIEKIRVLVVDDSSVVRSMLTK